MASFRERIVTKKKISVVKTNTSQFVKVLNRTLLTHIKQKIKTNATLSTAPAEVAVAGALIVSDNYMDKDHPYTDGIFVAYRVGIDNKYNIAVEFRNSYLDYVCLCTSDKHIKDFNTWRKHRALANQFSSSVFRTFRATQSKVQLELLENFNSTYAN